jgi:methionyl-tRNA formyltransferase
MEELHSLRIIFMGTPEFAVPSLELLLENHFNILAVVTAPDKPAGRGMQLQQSAVKKFASQHSLKILQPEKLKDKKFIDELQSLEADLQVVVAFRMLPEIVWSMPELGTINLHASLLPQYRGAAPINWVIINGEKETGVTTFFLQHEIDTGKIIFQDRVAIADNETAGSLHDKLKIVGAQLILKTVKSIEEKNYPLTEQMTSSELKKAPKIFTEDGCIDWNQSAEKIYNLIRGLSPYPAAFTSFQNKTLKIFKASYKLETQNPKPGTVVTDHKTSLQFAARDGWINVLELQLEGKRKMNVE